MTAAERQSPVTKGRTNERVSLITKRSAPMHDLVSVQAGSNRKGLNNAPILLLNEGIILKSKLSWTVPDGTWSEEDMQPWQRNISSESARGRGQLAPLGRTRCSLSAAQGSSCALNSPPTGVGVPLKGQAQGPLSLIHPAPPCNPLACRNPVPRQCPDSGCLSRTRPSVSGSHMPLCSAVPHQWDERSAGGGPS